MNFCDQIVQIVIQFIQKHFLVFPLKRPQMLNQIIQKLLMSCSMAYMLLHLDKFLEHRRILVSMFNSITHVFKSHTMTEFITLVLHHHVLHDHTNCHHLPQHVWIQYFFASPRTTAKRALSTLNALSTSILAPSCL